MNNILAIIVAFYLAKYNEEGLKNLNFCSFNEAFERIALLLGVKKNYVKLRRDEFDPVFPWRQGWKRPMDKRIIKTIDVLDSLDEPDLREIINNILYDPSFRESDELNEIIIFIKSGKDKKIDYSKFIVRCPTGRAAEDFFQDQFLSNNITSLNHGELVDCRDMGCGYDYKIIDKQKCDYYIEVKGMFSGSGGILFTDKEWKTAKEKGEKYFLCIVRNIGVNPEIELINNPSRLLVPKKNIKPSIQISWSVTNSDLLKTNQVNHE